MRQLRRMVLCSVVCWVLWGVSGRASAECIELKNDTFQENAPQVTAVRSFCISEFFGSIFVAPKDITLQKVRMLVSGDGKTPMLMTPIKVLIFKEKAPDSADPMEPALSGEEEYGINNTQLTPQWIEVKTSAYTFKAGERFRVTFAHDNIDCENINTTKPYCAGYCEWWGATVDKGPIKENTNVVLGKMFDCQGGLPDRKWRFWKDLPEACRPTGNLILRAYVYDGNGRDCNATPQSCVPASTQACTCADGNVGNQTCAANGVWGTCTCGTPQSCTPNATEPCTCTNGKSGQRTCGSAGQWGACVCASGCTTGATQPCVCGDGKSGTQTCEAGGKWAACVCKGTSVCAPGATQACTCTTGTTGAQTCNTEGSAWLECKCVSAQEPKVTRITPEKGLNSQNTDVTVIGENFVEGAKVYIGTAAALEVSVLGPKSIAAKVPAAIKPGLYDVVVENPGGKSGRLDKAFSVEAAGCGCSQMSGREGMPLEEVFFVLMLWGLLRRRSIEPFEGRR